MHPTLRALRRWPVIVGIVAVALIGGGAGAWALTRSSGSTGSTQLVAAKMTTVNQTVSSSGTIEPAKEADLDFTSSGPTLTVGTTPGIGLGSVLEAS